MTNTVEPVARKIIHYRLGVFSGGRREIDKDAEDLCSEVVLQTLARLRHLKSDPASEQIRDLKGFAAMVAHRECADYFRRKFPDRWRLKTRLRYLLTHQKTFALWEDSTSEYVAGLAEWSGQSSTMESISMVAVSENRMIRSAAAKGSLPELVDCIFRYNGNPLALDRLVYICAGLLGIQDKPAEGTESLADLPSAQRNVLGQLEQQSFLRDLWNEIAELPERQRQALLFSLRDSDGGALLPLIPASGVASLEKLAVSLNVSREELLALWNRLPLEDHAIAQRLAISRQQVINLRKSARARLSRRMKT